MYNRYFIIIKSLSISKELSPIWIFICRSKGKSFKTNC